LAFDFPSSPTDGQQFTPAGGPTYVYKTANGAWRLKTGSGAAATSISDNPPSTPTVGQLWYESDTGNTYIWYDDGDSQQWVQINVPNVSGIATSNAKNRVCNPAMQISQENGTTLIGPASALAHYGADQWISQVNVSPGTVSLQSLAGVTPNGSKNRLRMVVGTAKAALAAGDFMFFQQMIEGIRVADFRFGSASAKQAILRFGFKGPAGTYAIALRNGGYNRSYLATFTISAGQANTDTTQTLIIPGDVTGTWTTDNTIGFNLAIVVAAGSTGNGALGWQAGSFYSTSAVSNGMATASNTFDLFDVGLYLDPSGSGIPPAWEMPDEAAELIACKRYYQQWGEIAYTMIAVIQCMSTTAAAGTLNLPVSMRIPPTSNSSGNFAVFGSAGAAIAATLSGTNVSSSSFHLNATASGLVAGNATSVFTNNDANARLKLNARM
jgi:hypothetical protein